MSAEIVSATDDSVRVKLGNGKVATIELSKLSEDDQSHDLVEGEVMVYRPDYSNR